MSLPERSDGEPETPIRTIAVSEEDAQAAARLLARVAGAAGAEGPLLSVSGDSGLFDVPDRTVLVERARKALSDRQRRTQYFSRAVFGEPVWDILLILYISDFSGTRLTIGKLAELIDTPLTTTLRWIGYLEKEHLLERQPHPNDKRMGFIRMLGKARDALDTYFASI